MGVSEHRGTQYRPEILELLLKGHPQKGPLMYRNSRVWDSLVPQVYWPSLALPHGVWAMTWAVRTEARNASRCNCNGHELSEMGGRIRRGVGGPSM